MQRQFCFSSLSVPRIKKSTQLVFIAQNCGFCYFRKFWLLSRRFHFIHPYKLIQDNFVFSPDIRNNDKAWYQQGQRQDPATVRFLSLKDYGSLRMSGMGQLGIFWIDMGERLGSFLDLRWWDYSDTPMHRFRADLYRDGEVLRTCTERLKGRLSVSCIGSGIPDTDRSTILRILTGKGFGFAASDIRTVFDPASCSIVLKHDAGYYAGKTDITRKFYRDHPRSALQGITSEGLRNFDYEKKTPVMKDDSTIATMLRACVIALAVKSDIQQGKMTLTSLARHGFTAPVSFAMAYRSEESGRKSPTHYFCMTVDPSDGSLTFSHFTHDELLRDRTEWQIKIASAFGMDGDLTEHNPLGTELAFWEDIDDIHVIRNTGENVIPNVELLVRDYEAMSGKKMTLNEFEKRFGRYRADMIAAGTFSAEELGGYWQKIMEKLKGETVLSYAQLQSAIYHRDSLKFYNRFKPYPPDFAVFPRTGDHLVKYGLLPLTGGWWFRTPSYNPENPGETRVDSVSYFLGSKDSLNYSQERGVVIRQIIRRNGKPVDDAFIRKILGMMYVDFVRIKQWTVLPFPAKYLREYIDIMKTQSPEGLRTAADAVQDEDGTD